MWKTAKCIFCGNAIYYLCYFLYLICLELCTYATCQWIHCSWVSYRPASIAVIGIKVSNHFYTTASQSSDFCCVELWCLAICNVPQLHTTQSAPLAHTTAITCYNCSTVITSTLITSVNDTIMRFLKFIEITAYSLPNSVVHLLVRTKK